MHIYGVVHPTSETRWFFRPLLDDLRLDSAFQCVLKSLPFEWPKTSNILGYFNYAARDCSKQASYKRLLPAELSINWIARRSSWDKDPRKLWMSDFGLVCNFLLVSLYSCWLVNIRVTYFLFILARGARNQEKRRQELHSLLELYQTNFRTNMRQNI